MSYLRDSLEYAKDEAYKSTYKNPITGKPLPSPNREQFANIGSILFFSWMNPMMRQGERRPLSADDLWDLKASDKANYCVRRYNEQFK
jgi:hypothetical protein